MVSIEPFITPIYISAANMVAPLATINLDSLYENVRVGVETVAFIMNQGIVETFSNLTLNKMIYIVVIYNLFILI